jgi:hypothetical protein
MEKTRIRMAAHKIFSCSQLQAGPKKPVHILAIQYGLPRDKADFGTELTDTLRPQKT